MEKSNKGLYILLCVLIALLLILSGYIIYDKVLSKNDIDNSVERNDVENNGNNNVNLDDIYNNKNSQEEYIIFNVDKTATIKYATGGGPAQLIENIVYEISYDNKDIFVELIYDKIPSPICKKYLVKIENGEYVLDVTTPTPASTPGDYSFIKE